MRRGVEWRKIGWGKVPNMNPVNNTRRELNEVLKNKKCNEFCGMKREFDKIKEEALAREGKRLKRDLDGILGELEAGGNDVASNVMFYETIIVL